MIHAPEEVLAALAVGDPDVEPAVREHVDGCPVCAQEVSELAHVHGLLGEEFRMPELRLDAPDPQVWQRILAETSHAVDAAASDQAPGDGAVVDRAPVVGEQVGEVSAAPVELPKADRGATSDDVPSRLASVSTPSGAEVDSAHPVAALEAPDDDTHTGSVVPITDGHRTGRHAGAGGRRRAPWLFAAAAACLILVGALVGRAVWSGTDPSGTVVSSVALTTLDSSRRQEGTAQLLDSRGVTELRVDTTPMSVPNGFVEVWLINTDGKRMVSLGVLSTSQAVFPVPAEAIAEGYTVVDLSHEQYDDRPQHSGDSLMRGTLPV